MRGRVAAAVVGVLIVTSAVAAAAPEARTVTVSPDVDLVDGDVVTVAGTGWERGAQLALFQCAKPGGQYDCRRMLPRPGHVTVATDGTFAAEARVRTVFEGDSGTIDCRAVACVLAVDFAFRIDRPRERLPATPEGDDFPLVEHALGFDPVGPLLPPATLTATPDTGLVHGDAVDVTGTGFTPDGRVALHLCPPAPSEYYECDFSGPFPVEVTADAGGAISATIEVVTVLWGFDTPGVDCRTVSCRVVAFEDELPGDPRAEATLAFDPDGALPPRPIVSVTPSTGLVDGQVVTVRGSGFRPHAGMYLDQCLDDGTDDPWDCRYTDGFGEADENGDVEATFTVRESFNGVDGRVRCAQDPCIVTVLDFQGDPLFKLPIEFLPTGGPPLEGSCDLVHVNPEDLFIDRLAAGPDGNVWFSAIDDGDRARIGFVTTEGLAITTFDLGPDFLQVDDLVAGPDGNLWFTGLGRIWRSTPSGTVSEVADPGSAGPIVVGPDGALWFGMSDGVGRVTTAGDLTEFTSPSVGDRPEAMGTGPDGLLWYSTDGEIRRITSTGEASVVASGVTDYGVSGLASGGGHAWTSLQYDNRIGRISPEGAVTRFGEPGQLKEPVDMVNGPDGANWFVLAQGNRIGRVDLDGGIDTFVDGQGRLQEPRDLVLGPDGRLWVSAQGSGVARVDRCGLVGPVAGAPGFTG